MIVKRQIVTTTETEKTVSLRISKPQKYLFCESCSDKREMLTINEAAILTKKSWRQVIDQAEIGNLHFTETADGEIYICSVSLSELSSGGKIGEKI